jgi:hypothetical protein
MITFRNFTTTAAALAIALTVVSAPAFAKSRGQGGHEARAQAVEGVLVQDGVSRDRAQALRECNNRAAPFKEYTWGNTQSDLYRVCMVQHGQPE